VGGKDAKIGRRSAILVAIVSLCRLDVHTGLTVPAESRSQTLRLEVCPLAFTSPGNDALNPPQPIATKHVTTQTSLPVSPPTRSHNYDGESSIQRH
jgi:hypothetical protein